MKNREKAKNAIREFLRDNNSLLKGQYRLAASGGLVGHCYVATESYYHVVGGRENPDYTPCVVSHEQTTHWFLDGPNGVIDLTFEQFDSEPPYEQGRGCGMQNTPSKRCVLVLEHLSQNGFEIQSSSYPI